MIGQRRRRGKEFKAHHRGRTESPCGDAKCTVLNGVEQGHGSGGSLAVDLHPVIEARPDEGRVQAQQDSGVSSPRFARKMTEEIEKAVTRGTKGLNVGGISEMMIKEDTQKPMTSTNRKGYAGERERGREGYWRQNDGSKNG